VWYNFPPYWLIFSPPLNNPEWAEKTGEKKKIEKQPSQSVKIWAKQTLLHTEGKRGTVKEHFGRVDTDTVLHPYWQDQLPCPFASKTSSLILFYLYFNINYYFCVQAKSVAHANKPLIY
jgi:hypothetical protein